VAVGRSEVQSPAQGRRAATELAILDAAESLIEQRRFAEISVEDVMAATGLGRTAFYRYFPELESVVGRLMARIMDEIWAASAEWLFSDDPRAPLADAVQRLVVVYRDHGRVLQAFEDAARGGSELRAQWNESLATMLGPLKSHLLRLMLAGRAEAEYPEQTIDALAVCTERYLLSVYGDGSEVDVEWPTVVLLQLWTRTLQLR
jgi:AcrR family transcriptional regulator